MTNKLAGAIKLAGREREVFICGFARSPFGRFNGALAELSITDIGAQVLRALLHKAKLDPMQIQALYAGIGLAGGAMLTATRQVMLKAGLDESIPSKGIDRACCSGMTAIGDAAKDISLGLCDVAIAGGMESLSNTPLFLPRRHDVRPGAVQITDPLILRGEVVEQPIATYSGHEALRFGVDRAQQDAWAQQSHTRYFAAKRAGHFDNEIVPVTVAGKKGDTKVSDDEGPRADSSLEKLASLNTVYQSPTITAGNAPGLSDGAAFMVLATKERAKALGLPIIGKIVAYAQIAGAPTSGTSTPALALQRALLAAEISLRDLSRIEINEAYAATPLVSTQVLAQDSTQVLAQDSDTSVEHLRELTNPWGGAVALGHPLGASGARLVMTGLSGLLHQPHSGKHYAGAAICGGFGQGDAIIVERI